MTETQYLTKSRYTDGLICKKLLWFEAFDPVEFQEPDPGSPVDVGITIGKQAHSMFPNGVSIDAKPWEHDIAVADTVGLMEDSSIPAIFEAAFEFENIRIRVDVLERLRDGSWGLREVKSSTRVKPEPVDDAAIQFYVLNNLDIDVSSIELVHVNNEYVRGSGEINWEQFFKRTNISEDVMGLMVDLETEVKEQKAVLSNKSEPIIQPGPHCPDDCPYWERCTAAKPDDWIYYLPRLHKNKFNDLVSKGYERISKIPDDYQLTTAQDRMRDVVKSGQPYISPNLSFSLDKFGPPAVYLDFEAMNPAIPIYEGTSPYQRVLFQWSLHAIDTNNELNHCEFLAKHDVDPRQAFADSLLAAVSQFEGPVIVYSPYEKTSLKELGSALPNQADDLDQIILRLSDLLPVVRDNVYLQEFNGSFSIKSIGPALVKNLGYDDLGSVQDGQSAAIAFQRLATNDLSPGESADEIRRDLLDYCKLDTLAMVEVHRALNALMSSAKQN